MARSVSSGAFGLALGACLGACALPPARWDVPEGGGPAFAEARKACQQLTDPETGRFDDCMERRGFERESLAFRVWRAARGY